RAAQLMNAHPEVGLCYGETIRTPSPVFDPTQIPQEYGWEIVRGEEFIETLCRSGQNPVLTPSAVVRTSLQHQVGGYRTELPHSGDMEMWLRLAAHSSVGRIRTCQAYYRPHQANMFRSYEGVKDLMQRKLAFASFFAENGPALRSLDRLRKLVQGALW